MTETRKLSNSAVENSQTAPRYVYGVITHVPDPEKNEHGNLAVEVDLWLSDLQGEEEKIERYPLSLLSGPRGIPHSPVFDLGEVVILACSDGREVVGKGRKPSKWWVTCEEFDNIEAAIARAIEVRGW